MRECKTCKHADFSAGAVFCCTICKCPLDIRNEVLEEAAKHLESDAIKEEYSTWCMGPDEAAAEVRKLKEE